MEDPVSAEPREKALRMEAEFERRLREIEEIYGEELRGAREDAEGLREKDRVLRAEHEAQPLNGPSNHTS